MFAASLRDLGAIFAVLYLGLAIDRIGPERALALHYAAGAVFIAVIALFALPYSVLSVCWKASRRVTGGDPGASHPAPVDWGPYGARGEPISFFASPHDPRFAPQAGQMMRVSSLVDSAGGGTEWPHLVHLRVASF
jgi:hypothetical protein